MIYWNLSGGLGNMLFQTAAAEWMGKKYGKEVCYNNAKEHFEFLLRFGQWVSHSSEYHSVFRFIDWFKNCDFINEFANVVDIPFHYFDFRPIDGVEYRGYFQSEKYFDGDWARFIFTPTNRVNQRVGLIMNNLSGETCSVHVRRGNYVKLQDKHVLQPMSYYVRAIEHMRSVGANKFVVFSDDIEWCKQNFEGDEFVFVHDTDYVELFCMSRCKHNIIANSSFSWWGAYLGSPIGRVVIAPSKWFPKSEPNSIDIIPNNWIKL